jgi:hypothetical protein
MPPQPRIIDDPLGPYRRDILTGVLSINEALAKAGRKGIGKMGDGKLTTICIGEPGPVPPPWFQAQIGIDVSLKSGGDA